MPIAVAAPPERVQIFSGFDYVIVDEQRRRAYAAHSRSDRLLVVDASTGKVLAQVDVGPMHGLAIDPATGNVFTGNGTDRTLSKVDPATMKVLASVDVPGDVDAIAYDPSRGRVYADQDNGSSLYVIDGNAMKLVATIPMPDEKLESPAVDPATGMLYQNLAKSAAFAIVDPSSLKIVKVVKTPQLENNHPLVFAPAANQVIVGGTNGVLSAYAPDGTHVGDAQVQPHIDQCSTGSRGSLVVCAGRGIITVVAVVTGSAPRVIGRLDTGHARASTVGFNETNNDIWIVYSDENGDWVQRLRWSP